VGVKLSKLYCLPEKLANKGNLCLMVGYPEDHPSDTYRVFDLKSQSVMLTRNVRWTGKTFGEYFHEKTSKIMEGTDVESSDDEDIVIHHSSPEINSKEEFEVSKKVAKPMKKLTIITRSRALADAIDDDVESSEEEIKDSVMLAEEILGGDPSSFNEAFFHQDEKKREGWRAAIRKKLESMEKCNVWSIVDRGEMQKGRKLVGNHWVFVQKRDGTYRGRLDALGYSQVAGVDFSNHYSRMLCDTSFRVFLLIIQKMKLPAWSIDIETAFLNGDLSEEIFMKIPDGFKWFHGD
jgi:Reverse transcriptase (RNA-dependent DNA polymerase)